MVRTLRSLAVRLRAIAGRRSAEAELDEELHYHLQREVERQMAGGLSAPDARLAAKRAFGNVGYLKEEMRDTWGGAARVSEELRQDVRFALRGFRRSPSFVVTVVLTIALALGLNTSVFTIFDAYVLRPIAIRDAGELYQVFFSSARGAGRRLTMREYEDLRQTPLPAETFAFAPAFARVAGGAMFGNVVSGDALAILGARPALGRMLVAEDAAPPAGTAVIVLGYDAWQAKFGDDSSIVGKQVLVRGVPLTVVGVAEKGFTGVGPIPLDFWAPITMLGMLRPDGNDFGVNLVVRLRGGTDERRAAAALAAWSSHETAAAPDSLRLVRTELHSLRSALSLGPETIAMFAPAAVAFALVLLIACANVANVMLARGLARQREIGIRLSLGAERGRVVRQLLSESILLALPAAVLGYILSRWTIAGGVRIMFASAPADFSGYLRVIPFTPDPRVFTYVLLVALASAVLFGLVPALQATRPTLVAAARGDFDAGLRSGRLRSGLLVAQIVVCSLLLIVTGLLLRGSEMATHLATGMRTADVVQVNLDDRSRAAALRQLHTDSVVTDLGATVQSPLDGTYPVVGMRADGDRRIVPAAYNFVDAGFFRVLGIQIARGRSFTTGEERDVTPVAIVSEAAARALWPGREAVGQLIQLGQDAPHGSRLAGVRVARVIGVATDAVSGWLGTGLDRPVVYYPLSADSAGARILTRVHAEVHHARDQIDRDIAAVAPGAVYELHPLDEYLAVQHWPFQIFSWVSSAIGVIALLLTLVGVYGVLSYLVAQRTREIGIRMALGASINTVVGLVLRQTFRYAVLGIACGTVLALGVSKLFASVIFIIDAFDPLGYSFGMAVVLAACVLAAWAPSRRAARVNPVDALRQD